MTRLGTLRVTAPPPSPPQDSPPQSTAPPQRCAPPQTPHTPSSSTPNPSPHPSPPTPSQQAPTPLRQPPLSKNLRWTAVALVSKLSKELERPSSAIADEVALAASHDMRTRFPERDVAPVERNTRRRVYDALKVMVAVGCIQRHAKDLRWIGVDHLRYLKANNGPNIRVSLCESRRRIGRKKTMLTEMHRTIKAFDALYTRRHREHQWRNQQPTPLASSHRIQFPMVVVNAQNPQVTYSPDRKRVRISTQAPFRVYAETDLVAMLADRTALKRPKIAKKRRPARGTSGASYSGDPLPASFSAGPPLNADNLTNSSQPRHLPDQSAADRKQSDDAVSKRGDANTVEDFDASKQNNLHKKDSSRTKDSETNIPSDTSTDSRKKRRTDCDGKEDSTVEPEKQPLVKAEPKEIARTDAANSTTGLPEQILICNIPTSSRPSARHDGPDSESICPSAVGTQGEREVSTGPLICDEELGIPPLADGDSSSPASDDDPMIGWTAGEEDENDFEQVFRAPMFHQV